VTEPQSDQAQDQDRASRLGGPGIPWSDVRVVMPTDPLLDGLAWLERRLGAPELLRALDSELRRLGFRGLEEWCAHKILGSFADLEPALAEFRRNATVHAVVSHIERERWERVEPLFGRALRLASADAEQSHRHDLVDILEDIRDEVRR
jgi:hypothetical protein